MIVGGKAIASGAYGCVFKPAIKCKGGPEPASNMISKLMLTNYANAEYDEIKKFSSLIKGIPNYSDYFIIDPIQWCIPEKLSIADKKDFDLKCSNLTKKGIKSANVNSQLSKLRLINMPDGGVDLDFYFKANPISTSSLHIINENVKDLLLNAILPMNEKNLYHLDLKAGNLLIDSKNKVRIVDWGLSGVATNNKTPDILKGRPVQYNCPFSSLLINSMFLPEYKKYLKYTGKDFKLRLREFVITYYDKWSKHRGSGHEDYIEYISKNIFFGKLPGIKNQTDIIKYNIAKAFIYNFLVGNLEKFTIDGEFKEKEFMDVFLHNVDIWGLLMVYEPIFFYARKKPTHITFFQKEKVLEQITTMLLKYCFDNPATKISVSNLINDINLINSLLKIPASKISHKPVKKLKKFKIVEERQEKISPRSPEKTKKRRKRCPNGTRKNKNPPPECLPK